MPPLGERPPIPDERRLAVSQWIEHNVRPVARTIAEGTMDGQVADHPFEVRDHQVEGWDALWQSRLGGTARALIHLATGGGKTTLAAVDFMKYREECAQMDPPVEPRALYVSHKREINDQAAETIREFMPDLEEHFFDTRKANNRPEADITYAPIQSIYSKLHTFDPEEFEYIIWDEAHHLEAETYKKVLEYFNPLFEYALTGTPDRADGKDIRDYFGEAILSKGLPEGIAEGWLADVDYHIVFDKAIKDAVKAGFNPKTLTEIKELFEKKASPESLAESIREEIEKLGLENPKTMVFCESIEEADEMARLLGGVAYHSDTPDRPQILKDFKSGKIRVVTSKDMFNEGVNVPDAEVVIFLRATDSEAVFIQQLGRGLRKLLGKDKVYVLDFVANIERIAKIRELSELVQRRAHECGDPEVAEQRLTGDGEGGSGLRVHSRHGDFDFDTVAVDLLEKWGAIRDAAAPSELINLSNDELVAYALELKPNAPLTVDEINRLSQEKFFVSASHIAKRFGSVSEFQRACGFGVEGQARVVTKYTGSRYMSDADLVSLARHLKPEGALTTPEIKQLSKEGKFASAGSIIQRFGSIPDFQTACGHETLDLRAMTNDDIINLAKELSPQNPLSMTEMKELAENKKFPSPDMVRVRFGSVKEFQQACGFEPVRRKKLHQEDTVVEQALSISPNAPLTYPDIKRLSKEGKFVSQSTVYSLFGTIEAFHEACGFVVEKRERLDLAQLSTDDIVKIALQLSPDRPLPSRSIRELSKEGKFVSDSFIRDHFGSLGAFHKACGFKSR